MKISAEIPTPKKKYNYTKKPGRPPKKIQDIFPPDWKERIFAASILGKSNEQIRRDFCVVNSNFREDIWYAIAEREEEFSKAIKIGKVLCEAWWQDISQDNLTAQHFQTGSWYANMKNRFGWKDPQIVDNSQTHITVIDKLYAASKNGKAHDRTESLRIV